MTLVTKWIKMHVWNNYLGTALFLHMFVLISFTPYRNSILFNSKLTLVIVQLAVNSPITATVLTMAECAAKQISEKCP